jgi:hypothetical protein
MKNAKIHTDNKVRETTKSGRSGRRTQMEKHQLATQEANHQIKNKKIAESQPPVML